MSGTACRNGLWKRIGIIVAVLGVLLAIGSIVKGYGVLSARVDANKDCIEKMEPKLDRLLEDTNKIKGKLGVDGD